MFPLETSREANSDIQPELMPGERIFWSGRPSNRVIFHKQDALLIPFSLLWGGFAIFWEAGVLGFGEHGPNSVSLFMSLWGIPFVLVGQYLIWGRFLHTAWKKKRTSFAVTNRRVIAIQGHQKRRVASAFLDTLPAVMKEGGSNGVGTLRFSQSGPAWSGRRGLGPWDPMAFGETPDFIDIENLDSVYRLVCDSREKATAAKTAS